MLLESCRPVVRQGLMMVSLLALCSCADLFNQGHKEPAPQPVQKKTYDAPAYVNGLSSANVILSSGGTLKDAASDLKIIESYTSVKRTKTVQVPAAVLYYTTDNSKTVQRSPVYTGAQGQDTAALSKLMKRLEPAHPVLSEIKVQSLPVSVSSPFKQGKQDAAQVTEALQARQVELLAGGLKMGRIEEARIHIALLEFFMERKQKDAAYLSADAARRLLAKAVQKKAEEEQASALTTKLDTLEGQLRQTMPY